MRVHTFHVYIQCMSLLVFMSGDANYINSYVINEFLSLSPH